MKTLLVILLFLTACTSHKEMVQTERHADTVAALRSHSVQTIDRAQTWEYIVMRPDTATGQLRVVTHNVLKHTDNAVAVKNDTTAKQVTASQVSESRTETTNTTAPAQRKYSTGDIIMAGLIWTVCIAGVMLLAKYLLKKWTLRL